MRAADDPTSIMREGGPLRILVADAHPLLLDCIVALLLEAADVEIVGKVSDGAEALRLIEDLAPSIAILDASMPDMDAYAIIKQCLSTKCQTRFIVLSTDMRDLYVEEALQAGAKGFVIKRAAGENLLCAVRIVSQGGIYLDPSVVSGDPGDEAGPEVERSPVSVLSKREEQVLHLAALGLSDSKVAAKLGITARSAAALRIRAADKLGISTRAYLIRYALTHGWLVPASNMRH